LLEFPALARVPIKRPSTVIERFGLLELLLPTDENLLVNSDDTGVAVAPHRRRPIAWTHTGVDGTFLFNGQVERL
jgi:hypothetical protein